MKRLSLIASALAVLGLTACKKGLVEDIEDVGDGQVKNSLLQVRTRAGGLASQETTVSYPVTVYVFQGDECRAVQTIGDEGQALNIPLTEGTYSVYAIGGASASDYVLSDADDATVTSAIVLKEGKTHGDLMAASTTAALVDGGTNTVTLGMTRKTMLIQNVTIKKIPTAATAVSVTIAPLWQSLTVGGTYSTTNGSSTIALTKQEDGRTWQNATSAYLLPPSSQPASVSVNITIGSTTKTYTYSTNNELESGYKINIEGTYTEAVGVNLTGTIIGATWLGERTISFEFDENGSTAADEDNSSSDDDNGSIVGDLPAVGSFYQGCYVLKSIVADDGQSAELTLLSPNETTIGKAYNDASFIGHPEVLEALIDEKLAEADVDGISDWRLPTYDELNVIYAALSAINDTFESDVSASG
ncbi:MAG: hypothetical protein K5899_03295, partial [Bacteroidaceae bacterium]|nr:hypothetical protein [Bacteroidaceae bacterium]